MRVSRGLKWENKMYKLKRSIKTLQNTLKTEVEVSFTFASRFARLIK